MRHSIGSCQRISFDTNHSCGLHSRYGVAACCCCHRAAKVTAFTRHRPLIKLHAAKTSPGNVKWSIEHCMLSKKGPCHCGQPCCAAPAAAIAAASRLSLRTVQATVSRSRVPCTIPCLQSLSVWMRGAPPASGTCRSGTGRQTGTGGLQCDVYYVMWQPLSHHQLGWEVGFCDAHARYVLLHSVCVWHWRLCVWCRQVWGVKHHGVRICKLHAVEQHALKECPTPAGPVEADRHLAE